MSAATNHLSVKVSAGRLAYAVANSARVRREVRQQRAVVLAERGGRVAGQPGGAVGLRRRLTPSASTSAIGVGDSWSAVKWSLNS